MENQTHGGVVAPDPQRRKLAIAKLWSELYVAHKNDDKDLVEELEYQAMMLWMACQEVSRLIALHHLDEENHNL